MKKSNQWAVEVRPAEGTRKYIGCFSVYNEAVDRHQVGQARKAIKEIGPVKTMPWMIKWLQAKDSEIEVWICSYCVPRRMFVDFWRREWGFRCPRRGFLVADLFEENINPAVNEIATLLNDDELVIFAA